VECWVVRISGGTKSIILSDEHVDALAEVLHVLREAMCGGNPEGDRKFKRDAFRLNVRRSRRMARLYSRTQYISLTL